MARFLGPTWSPPGAHLGPTGPSWAPCCPHESCYLGSLFNLFDVHALSSKSVELAFWGVLFGGWVVAYQLIKIIKTLLDMQCLWGTLPVSSHIFGMFLSHDSLLEQWTGCITRVALLYIRKKFTFVPRNNLQDCFRHNTWSSFWCLSPCTISSKHVDKSSKAFLLFNR